MDQFKTYLIDDGLCPKTAVRYAKVAAKYVLWLKENNLNVEKVKRNQFTDWLQTFREQGLKQRTIDGKESVIFHFYCFLGTPSNPALGWISRKDEHKLPPPPIERNELIELYRHLRPKTLVDYRNRCMLGFILFQGLKRIELEELRIGDVNFETGKMFVRKQRKSNLRWLDLETVQALHLQEYFKKHRKKLLRNKAADTGKFFLTFRKSASMDSVFSELLKEVRKFNPQIKDLYHIRTSVISYWLNEYGLMEAMIRAGHKNINTTKRYETKKYDELYELLKTAHPMEQADFIV